MTVSRTVIGLIYQDGLDAQDAWSYYVGASGSYAVVDTATKYSGAASFEGLLVGATAYLYADWYKDIDVGSGSGRVARFWHKTLFGNNWQTWFCGFKIDTFEPCTEYNLTRDWHHVTGAIPDALTGVQRVYVAYATRSPTAPYGNGTDACWTDALVICKGTKVRMTNLYQGQKVELYRTSDNALMATATCAAGYTYVDLEITAQEFPLQGYFKIYQTDGITLIETTSSYEVCGGDQWSWTGNTGGLTVSSDVAIIYRSAATGTPKTANITANLKTAAGANYPGATIYFSTTLGTVTPASDVTDVNGNAETALTATTHGLAIIKATFLGDAVVPACSGYFTVHVFYEAEAADAAKKFQLYIEGIEYVFVAGHYTQNEIGAVNNFEAELPEWISTITINGFVSIYRKGTKEFAGILTMPDRSLSDNLRVVLKGPDVSALLNDRVVDTKIYAAKSAAYIINDLLTSFPCGITAGTLNADGNSLTITVETELLSSAIPRIADLINWKYRVNVSRTLDFAESFTSGVAAASFTEGEDIAMLDRQANYSSVKNYIRMKGSGISSTKQDGTKIQTQGLHQGTAFNKSISNQATLDAACQAYLDLMKVEDETIPAEVIDEYAPGTFGAEDYITVTSPTTDMSGTYQVRKIKRDLRDPTYASLDLSNKAKEYWDLDAKYRRMVKDASV